MLVLDELSCGRMDQRQSSVSGFVQSNQTAFGQGFLERPIFK